MAAARARRAEGPSGARELERALGIAGPGELAWDLGVTRRNVTDWRRRGRVPAERQEQLREYLRAYRPGPKLSKELTLAVRLAGSKKGLAEAIEAKPQEISQWVKAGKVPSDFHRSLLEWLKEARKPKPKTHALRAELGLAVIIAGNKTKLARNLGLKPREVSKWVENQDVPPASQEILVNWLNQMRDAYGDIRPIYDWKHELEVAISLSNGREGLAKRLGLTIGTIRRWENKGPSGHGRSVLMEYHLLRAMEKNLRPTGEEVLNAKLGALSGDEQRLLDTKSSSERRDGDYTEGWRWTKRWRRHLTPELATEIFLWFITRKQQNRAYDRWHGAIVTFQDDTPSGGKQGPVGYEREKGRSGSIRFIQVKGDKIEGVPVVWPVKTGTHAFNNVNAVADEIKALLDDIIISNNYCHVVSTTVYNYRKRTTDEHRAIAAERSRQYRQRKRRER